MDKKALSSIIGILLLLIIMILATFALFNFYKSSSSQLQSELEEDLDIEEDIDLLWIEGGILYYENTLQQEIVFQSISIYEESSLCNIPLTFLPGKGSHSITSCVLSNSAGSYTIIMKHRSDFFVESVINRDFY